MPLSSQTVLSILSSCSSLKTIRRTSSSVKQICFVPVKNMPVITALAVAAHRQNHHMCSSPDGLESRSEMVSRRFRLLSCGSVDGMIPRSPMIFRNRVGSLNVGSAGYYARSNMTSLGVMQHRNYAKGKDKVSTKKSVVKINEEEMSEVIDTNSLKTQLEKLLEQMKEEFGKQLSIRGAAGALESLPVEFEGETYPLQELAQVGRKNPQLAVLSLASLPDAIQPVLKAIRESGMNLNPQQEGTTLYVALPKVTREHRENLAKNAKTIFNKYKTNFQSVQNKFVKQCKSQKDISEDLSFRVQQQIMKLTETSILEAEKLMLSKQSELLEQK